MNIEVGDFFSVTFQMFQPLYPILIIALIVGLIVGIAKGLFDSLSKTKIGAGIMLCVILGFLVKQGVL